MKYLFLKNNSFEAIHFSDILIQIRNQTKPIEQELISYIFDETFYYKMVNNISHKGEHTSEICVDQYWILSIKSLKFFPTPHN